jgi:hypothetical protein
MAFGGTGEGGIRVSGGTLGSGGFSGNLGSGGVPATGGTNASGGTLGGGAPKGSGGATKGSGGATKGSGGSGGNLGSGGTPAAGGSRATGGTVAAGGSPSGGSGGGICPNVAACGGDTVGTWTVMSSCLSVSGELDMSQLGLGCKSAQVTGSLQVTGDWTGKSNGKYTDNTTTTGTEQLVLPASCLLVSGTTLTCERLDSVPGLLGYDSVSCKPLASGGCTCSAIPKQAGWPGLLSPAAWTQGTYTTSGATLTLDDEASYSYCVSGSKMTWTPQSKYPSIMGTVVFQKAGGGG